MTTKTGGYQLNEKDIDGVLKFLKATDPEHATPEMAMALLEHLKAHYHTMAHFEPEELEKEYKELLHEIEMKKN
ncbi:MAG TPA: hypothetical protein VMR81_04020 [Patescibacteria group bacterium]|nr:hypothetical protein [Patescibacteria group bacterium]